MFDSLSISSLRASDTEIIFKTVLKTVVSAYNTLELLNTSLLETIIFESCYTL